MKIFTIALLVLFGGTSVHADIVIKRGYVDMRYGQLHYMMADPGKRIGAKRPALIYFTQSPYSSIEFGNMLREMARDRLVLAIDTPGYGGSDGPSTVPTIEDYEAAVAEGLKNLGFGPRRKVDLIGLHTGGFTAVEMALREPQMVRSVTMVSVYLPTEERRLTAIANLPRYKTTQEFFAWFQEALPRLKQRQTGKNLTDEQWGHLMAESLRPLTHREFGHDAAFEYVPRFRLRAPLVQQPVLVLAIDDGIHDLTLASLPLFHNATLLDFPQLEEGAFFNSAPQLGQALRSFLDKLH